MVILIGVLLIVDICKILLQLDYDIVVGSRRVLRDDSIYGEVSATTLCMTHINMNTSMLLMQQI